MPKGGGKGAKKAAAPLDYSALEKGMKLQADGGDGHFYAAEVVTVSTAKNRSKAPVKVHFVGYTADSDVWCGGDQLRSKALRPKKEEKVERAPREPRQIWMFALTGGPCGGKGSCQGFLKEKLKEKGYDVYTVPEVPTIFFVQGGGCVTFPGLDAGDRLIQFESAIIKLQLQIEESFKMMAKSTGKKSIIFCDRGIMDIACYLPGTTGGDAWKSIVKANKLVDIKLLSRYAGVLHLQTAAVGAEKFYKSGATKDDAGNDVFRSEGPEQARELDAKVLGCWEKHRNLFKITNDAGATMADKCQKCLEAVLGVVEAPEAAAEAAPKSGGLHCGGSRGLPPWWITRGVTPAGPEIDKGTWKAISFSQEQQDQFSVDQEGKVLDQVKFDAAVAALK